MNIPGFLRGPIGLALSHWPWLARKISKIAINNSLKKSRHRPHPWSTVLDLAYGSTLERAPPSSQASESSQEGQLARILQATH